MESLQQFLEHTPQDVFNKVYVDSLKRLTGNELRSIELPIASNISGFCRMVSEREYELIMGKTNKPAHVNFWVLPFGKPKNILPGFVKGNARKPSSDYSRCVYISAGEARKLGLVMTLHHNFDPKAAPAVTLIRPNGRDWTWSEVTRVEDWTNRAKSHGFLLF